MATLDENSVDAIVTDPPYGLNFMGKNWDNPVMLGQKATGKEQRGAYAYGGSHSQGYFANDNNKYQEWCTGWATEALRVAKPGAHLLAFGGTRTFHRLACAIEDAGWEIRDTVMWVYGSGFPKSHNLKGDWQGWGTALKPAWEPIIVARKPLQGTVAANVLAWGTGALNIDATRIGTDAITAHGGGVNHSGRKYGGGHGIPALEAGSNGHVGRWPSNLIHDGSEEVLALMPSAARFFYCAKASKADRDEGLDGMEERQGGAEYRPNDDGSAGLQSRLHGATVKGRNHHPTVKPTALMRYLCRLVTPPGGVVLDPFMGSGSTGKAALQEGFRFTGIEVEPEYLEIAKGRIAAVQPCLN